MPAFLPVPVKSLATTDLATLFPAFPGTKDIRLHPVFKGGLSKWTWRFYTHRLTRAGRWFAGLTLFMLGAVSPSLDVQSYVPLSYACGLWGVTALCVLLNRPRVQVRASHAGRIGQNEILPVRVEVTQLKRFWGLDVNVLPACLPLEIDEQTPGGVPTGTLEPGTTRQITVPLVCKKRGRYTLRGFRVESDFPFGLVNAYREYRTESSLLVVPSYTPTRLEMPVSLRQNAGGMALATHLGDSFEFLGNREFREGDNLRDIDWRATARLGGTPVVREYREEYFLHVGMVLDTFLPSVGNAGKERSARRSRKQMRDAQAAQAEALEKAISVCASAADYLSHDYLIDFFAVGPELYELTAQRAEAHLEQTLDILAGVNGADTEPLPVVLPKIQNHLGQITSVVCVFLQWDTARQNFVEQLKADGVGVKVIVVPFEEATETGSDVGAFVTVSRTEETKGIL